jgi:hypothetical protein
METSVGKEPATIRQHGLAPTKAPAENTEYWFQERKLRKRSNTGKRNAEEHCK